MGTLSLALAAARTVTFYVFSAIYLPVILLALLVRPSSKIYYFPLGQLWVSATLGILGVRVEASGASKLAAGMDCVVLANHSSHLDPPAIVHALRHLETRWVCKQELRRVPVFGKVLEASGQIFINRGDTGAAVAELRRHLGVAGISIVFFPEGSRSEDGNLLPFKKGGAAFAIEAGLPVVPVAVIGAYAGLPKGAFVASPGVVRVVVGDPISTVGCTVEDRAELTERVRAQLSEMLAAGELEERSELV